MSNKLKKSKADLQAEAEMLTKGHELAEQLATAEANKKTRKKASGSKLSKLTTKSTKKYGDVQLPKLNGNGLAMLSTVMFASESASTDLRVLLWIVTHQNDPSTIGMGIAEITTAVIDWFGEIDMSKWTDYMAALAEIMSDMSELGLDAEVEEGK